jgi:hypothetical protein
MVEAIRKVYSGINYLCAEFRDAMAVEEFKGDEPHPGMLPTIA